MKIRIWLGTTLFLAVASIAAASAFTSQDKTPPPMSKEEMEMMQKWQAYATPGEAHKALEQKVGKWSLVVKMYMKPGDPPMESKCTAKHEWIMDGRYLRDTTEGESMGQPFHGMGIVGYDNFKKKYVSTWIDNMGTGVMMGEGTYDAATKTWNYTSEGPDFRTSKLVKTRSVEEFADADHWTMQMFSPGPDGKEYMSMEIEYSRMK